MPPPPAPSPAYQAVQRACSSCCCMVPEPLLRRPIANVIVTTFNITIYTVIVFQVKLLLLPPLWLLQAAASLAFKRRLHRHCHRCHECCAAQLLLQHCPRAVAKPSLGPVLLHNSSCPAAALASASPPAPPVVSKVHWLLCSSQHLR
jgi:hypothetical protein